MALTEEQVAKMVSKFEGMLPTLRKLFQSDKAEQLKLDLIQSYLDKIKTKVLRQSSGAKASPTSEATAAETDATQPQTAEEKYKAIAEAPAVKEFLAGIHKSEGGYVDDPNDPGGKTKYGIAEHREWPAFAKMFGLDSKKPELIKDITKEQVDEYYIKSRFEQNGLDKINSPKVINALFDQSILTPGIIRKNMKRALNDLGGHSFATNNKQFVQEEVTAINNANPDQLVEKFVGYQNAYYEGLAKKNPAKFQRYLKGWKNRTARLVGFQPSSEETTTTSSEESKDSSTGNKYVVVLGDTGYAIAKKKGISFEQLSSANPGVDWNRLPIGCELNIPSEEAPSSETNTVKYQNTTGKLLFEDKARSKHGDGFIEKVKEICKDLGLEPDFLMATIDAECGFNHKAVNQYTQASGLIQFMPLTAKDLGTTIQAIQGMTALEQLDYVKKYFKSHGSLVQKISEPAESYLIVFYPYAVGKDDDYVLGSQVSPYKVALIARQNAIYDLNKDGKITKGEIMEYMRKNKYKEAYDMITQPPENSSSDKDSSTGNKYVVVSGDTGYAIAKKKGISFEQLSSANPGVDWSRLPIGYKLNIPSGKASSSETNSSSSEENNGSNDADAESDERNAEYTATSTWDSKHTDRRIRTLRPEVQAKAFGFINAADKELGIRLRVTSAYRSIEEQNALFAKGGVTKARGGQSYHNYGLAIDVVEIKGDKALWNNPNWGKIGAMGKRFGFSWGGDWKSFVDKPHFEINKGSVRDLCIQHYPDLARQYGYM